MACVDVTVSDEKGAESSKSRGIPPRDDLQGADMSARGALAQGSRPEARRDQRDI